MPAFVLEKMFAIPPARLFQKLRDPTLLVSWFPQAIRCEPRVGEFGKARSQYTIVIASGTTDISLEEEVAEYRENEELTVFTEAPDSITKTSYLLCPIDDGTILRVEVDISGKNMFQELSQLLKKNTARERIERSLDQLKVIVEANDAVSQTSDPGL